METAARQGTAKPRNPVPGVRSSCPAAAGTGVSAQTPSCPLRGQRLARSCLTPQRRAQDHLSTLSIGDEEGPRLGRGLCELAAAGCERWRSHSSPKELSTCPCSATQGPRPEPPPHTNTSRLAKRLGVGALLLDCSVLELLRRQAVGRPARPDPHVC